LTALSASGAVRAQYETFPYPPRDPADEAKRLVVGSPSHWREIDHYCFGGKRDWRAPFRALVAGGGTGDGLIMLAQQLKDAGTPAEIDYLDLSDASRKIAEARAAQRGLASIRFHTGSLLDAAALAPGPYDYIDCCGVLHHLPDPAAGLAALAARLAPDGGMGLMLYGAYGRTGVYAVQVALRALGAGADAAQKIALARKLLADLPKDHWFNRNPFVADHRRRNDAGLYDLLLHAIDRPYTVPEILQLTDGAGLAVTGFIEPARYDPAHYLNDPELKAQAGALPAADRAALAETLASSMKTHVFYAVPKARAQAALAAPGDESLAPGPRETPTAMLTKLCAQGRLKVNFDGVPVVLDLPEGAAQLAGLCDGERSVGAMRQQLGWDGATFAARFGQFYAALNGLNLLLLRRSDAARSSGP
jgi:SAM-dependent methyltransferase